jgi:osmotically-inducible protein OsmY
MERHYDGGHEHRRYGRGERDLRDYDEQDFTRRSFAGSRFDESEPFPEDPNWRSTRERQERFHMGRFEPEPRRQSERFRTDPFGDRDDRRAGSPTDEPPWSNRFDEYPEAPGRRGQYGGHHSPEGWRMQHGWGRDVPRERDDGSDSHAGRFAGRGPKNYARSDDRVREDVCDRLMADPRIDASEVTVSVRSGEVTLEGTVDERRVKRCAEDVAESVSGVRQVHNRLTVQSRDRSDEELQPFQWGGERGWRGWEPSAGRGGVATRAPDAPYGAPYGARYGGEAPMPRAGVYGAARREADTRMRDEPQAGWLGEEPGRFGNRGPKGYQRSDDRICEDVCERLTADEHVDATNCTVIVKNGEVTLEGTVDDRMMKRRAEDCADAASGVRQVHNRLVVQPQPRRLADEPATSIGTSASAGSTAGTGVGGGRG